MKPELREKIHPNMDNILSREKEYKLNKLFSGNEKHSIQVFIYWESNKNK